MMSWLWTRQFALKQERNGYEKMVKKIYEQFTHLLLKQILKSCISNSQGKNHEAKWIRLPLDIIIDKDSF